MMRPGSIDLDLLRSFLRIIETGSFTRAGEMVGRSQSAVSMQVQRLEALLGQRLLFRSKGGDVRLTEHGSRLISRAREMLALNDSIWTDFHGPNSGSPIAPEEHAVPLQAQREAFTTQIMMTLLTNDKFTEAYAKVMRCVESNSVVSPVDLSFVDDESYMALLSMLEYVSINFLSNTIDRETVLRQRRSGLLRVWEVLHDYIGYKRLAWDRPNAYRSFERVVREHLILPNATDGVQHAAAHASRTSDSPVITVSDNTHQQNSFLSGIDRV